MDHEAVKIHFSFFFVFVVYAQMLPNTSPSSKHAWLWLQVYGSGLQRVEISTNQGKRTQELMHSPRKPISNLDTTEHLRKGSPCDFGMDQQKDPELQQIHHSWNLDLTS